jgi:hypothetical protein
MSATYTVKVWEHEIEQFVPRFVDVRQFALRGVARALASEGIPLGIVRVETNAFRGRHRPKVRIARRTVAGAV